MGRIAGSGQARQEADVDLSRILHPSYGLPRRVVLSLLADTRDEDMTSEPSEQDSSEPMAEVTGIDAGPRFLADRSARRRPGRR